MADIFLQINYTVLESLLDLENWQNLLWFLDTNHTVTYLEGWQSQQNTVSRKERKKGKRKERKQKILEKPFASFIFFLIGLLFTSMRFSNMNLMHRILV